MKGILFPQLLSNKGISSNVLIFEQRIPGNRKSEVIIRVIIRGCDTKYKS